MVAMPRTESFQQATEIVNNKSAMPAPGRRRDLVKNGALALALLAGTGLAGSYGHDYWTTGRFLESTDDAYVKAD